MNFLVLAVVCLAKSCFASRNDVSRNDAFIGYSELPYEGSLFKHIDQLVFITKYGDIEVELASSAAPETVAFIKDLVSRGIYNGCSFYRAEPPGDTYDQGSVVARKGYALVQGGLYSCGKQKQVELPLETRWKNTKGTVSLITGTSEFFFSLEDHSEWDDSFSVWGKVASNGNSFKVLETIAALPTRQEVHSTGTVMRLLQQEIEFIVKELY